MYDLQNNVSCEAEGFFPNRVQGLEGAFIKGKARVCGGYDTSGSSRKACSAFDRYTQSWEPDVSMNLQRNNPGGAVLNDNWFMTNGAENPDDVPEIFVPDVNVHYHHNHGQQMDKSHTQARWQLQSGDESKIPFAVTDACVVAINDREVAVLGGDDGSSFDRIQIYNMGSGKWRQGPTLGKNQGYLRCSRLHKISV